MRKIAGKYRGNGDRRTRPKREKRFAVDVANRSAFEYTRRVGELQAFRGNFLAETGAENAPKRKRTANGAPDGRARAAVETRLNRRGKIFNFF